MNIILCSGDQIKGQSIVLMEGKIIDMEQVKEKYLGREVKQKIAFNKPGTFKSYWAAEGWLKENGYSCGSMAHPNPTAICKGEYDLPEKWHNLTLKQKKNIAGLIISKDFREGEVTIILFED